MKKQVLKSLLATVVLTGFCVAQPVLNDVPSRVLGQVSPSLRSITPNLVEGREFLQPWGIAVDPRSGALYVSDFGNHRVLGWRSARGFTNGSTADIVIGQVDRFSTGPGGPIAGATARQTGITQPGALAVDANGNLYVADGGNNRVLRFPAPFSNNDELKTPDLVLGQPTFGSSGGNSGGLSDKSLAFSTSTTLGRTGLAVDTQGNLWVSDPLNHRVLRFPASALNSRTNFASADIVLGQPNFTTNTAPSATVNNTTRLDKTILRSPSGLTVDSKDRVYVGDALARVLVFTPPFTSGKAATRVLGVGIGTAGQPFTNAYNVLAPEGLFMASNDRPGVVDPGQNRVLIYDAFESWPEETAALPSPLARVVIGQNDFSGNRPNWGLSEPNAASLNTPLYAAFGNDELYVADTNNHRVLVYPHLTSALAATRILGQTDFTHAGANLVEGRELFLFNGYQDELNVSGNFSDGAGVVIDRRSDPPRLYIADTFNNRILGYADARDIQPGRMADIVIGQVDFSRVLINSPSNNPSTSSDEGLFRPAGLAVDNDGNLFVADLGNGRVLRFAAPFANRPAPGGRYRANLVIGQADFTARLTDPSARTMSRPFGVGITTEGHLVVTDAAHNRALFFRKPSGSDFTNGQAAEFVIGQPDFLTTTRGSGSNNLNSPRQVSIDTDDRLYIADAGNGRIAIYDRIPTASNNPATAQTINGLGSPQGVYVSPFTGEIWVADTRRNRASRYPRFDLLAITQRSEQDLVSSAPLALAQDSAGNLYVAEGANRIAVFYNSLSHQVAGSFADRPLSPGGIGIVYPRSASRPFSTSTVNFDSLTPALPLPRTLADTQVLLNGQPVPIYFVSPGQINFLVPMSTPDNGTATLEVVRASTREVLAAGTVGLARVSPAFFISGGSDQGQIAALNQDNTVNSPLNPIPRGQVIQLFGTGQGAVPGAPPDGELAGRQIPTADRPVVLIGTRLVADSDITYSGLAPGLVGVWQINVRVPTEFLSPGNAVDVVVSLRSTPSNIGFGNKRLTTTIAVRQ